MDVLIQAIQITPKFRAIDELQPATEVEAFVPSPTQKSSIVHGDVCYLLYIL